jgi:two-component system LytT family response regulator
MIKVVIVDDEEHARDAIELLLIRYFAEAKVIGKADSVDTAYEIITNKSPDLVFLDIRLGDGSGFDLLRKLKDFSFLLIFVTGYEEYAIQAFKVNAIDYLLKPFNPPEFANTVTRVRNQLDKNLQASKVSTLINQFFPERKSMDVKTFEFKTLGKDISILYDDIVQIVSDDKYSIIKPYLKSDIRCTKTLSEVESLLDDDRFIRIHKSHLVHKGYIVHFDEVENTLLLADQTIVKVSSRKIKEVSKLFPSK